MLEDILNNCYFMYCLQIYYKNIQCFLAVTPMFGDPDKLNDYLENFISHLTPDLRLESKEDRVVMCGEVMKYYFSDVSTPTAKLTSLIDVSIIDVNA